MELLDAKKALKLAMKDNQEILNNGYKGWRSPKPSHFVLVRNSKDRSNMHAESAADGFKFEKVHLLSNATLPKLSASGYG